MSQYGYLIICIFVLFRKHDRKMSILALTELLDKGQANLPEVVAAKGPQMLQAALRLFAVDLKVHEYLAKRHLKTPPWEGRYFRMFTG